MKKAFILCLMFIIIGFLLGSKYLKKEEQSNKYYFLEETYENNLIQDNITDIRKKVIEHKNNKTYVYLGITKNEKLANKIINMYKNENKIVQIEEVWIENDGFRINIEQLDLLAKKTTSLDEIIKIEEVALASYEEILKTKE